MNALAGIAATLGISQFRMFVYAGIALAVSTGAVALRQHYVNAGWDSALEAVKKQDATAAEAASKAQRTVDGCYAAGGTWSVITGNCTLEAKP